MNAQDIFDDELGPQFATRLSKIDVTKVKSEVLAAYVVTYRALSTDKEFAILCMTELADRRLTGDKFNFEEFIETELNKIPKIEQMDITKITGAIKGSLESVKGIKK